MRKYKFEVPKPSALPSLFESFEDLEDFAGPEIVGNNIYFYCEVSTGNILEFNKGLRSLDRKNIVNAINRQNDYDEKATLDPIVIYIQSSGGALMAGLSGMDTILQCKSPIYTVIDGFAASAATFLSVVGTKRFITPNSHALIHQMTSEAWGPYDKIKEEVINLDRFMDVIKGIYIKHTNIKEEELEDILSKDLFFSAERCLSLGIVDLIK